MAFSRGGLLLLLLFQLLFPHTSVLIRPYMEQGSMGSSSKRSPLCQHSGRQEDWSPWDRRKEGLHFLAVAQIFTTLEKLYDYNFIVCLSMFTLFMADYSDFCWNAQYSNRLKLAPSFLLSYEHFYVTLLSFSVYFTFNLPLNPILILAMRSSGQCISNYCTS